MQQKTVFEKNDFLEQLGKLLKKELRKEILLLYELGLEQYEIEYIVYLRTKERARHKWGG